MITVHRAEGRQFDRSAGGVWHAFDPETACDASADGFDPLVFLDEESVPPAADIRERAPHDGETVVYVREGGLTYRNPAGGTAVLRAGEFQRTKRDHGEDKNASSTDWVRVFWIGIRTPEPGLEVGHQQKRFSTAQRRGRLYVVASPDGRGDSLRVEQDVLVYSALLDPGQHVVHEIGGGRSMLLHLVEGVASVGASVTLMTADGAAISGERALSLTACTEAELLLFDVRRTAPAPAENRSEL